MRHQEVRGSGSAGPSGLLAGFGVAESMRADAPATVDALRRDGLALALLSGDEVGRVHAMAERLAIDRAEGAATPADKLAFVEALQRVGRPRRHDRRRPQRCAGHGGGGRLVRRRRGRRADADEGRLRADVRTPRRCRVGAPDCAADVRVVRQNLAWAVAYNAACVPLALAGWFPPWAAGLGWRPVRWS
jgi:Cu2+-exporting ATPase